MIFHKYSHQWIFVSETCETINNNNSMDDLAKLSLMDKLKCIWMKGNTDEIEDTNLVSIFNNNNNDFYKSLLISFIIFFYYRIIILVLNNKPLKSY